MAANYATSHLRFQNFPETPPTKKNLPKTGDTTSPSGAIFYRAAP